MLLSQILLLIVNLCILLAEYFEIFNFINCKPNMSTPSHKFKKLD